MDKMKKVLVLILLALAAVGVLTLFGIYQGWIRITSPERLPDLYEGNIPQVEILTDAVAFALRGAGFDLQQLVAKDVQAHPDKYDIEQPDPDIDFRRVKNLSVFFAGNAVSLTTDVKDVEAWQGGDIVVFQKHIGIVSDRRNEDGIPYVIHHSNPFQRRYEEDMLETRSDITGHYRMSP